MGQMDGTMYCTHRKRTSFLRQMNGSSNMTMTQNVAPVCFISRILVDILSLSIKIKLP